MGRPMTQLKPVRRLIRLLSAPSSQGHSDRQLIKSAGLTKSSGARYIKLIKERGINAETIVGLSDEKLADLLRPKAKETASTFYPIDLDQIDENFKVTHGYTLEKAFEGYKQNASLNNARGYGRSAFFKIVGEHRRSLDKNSYEALQWPAGQCALIDYAGDTLEVVDVSSGERIKVHVFVGILAYSCYSFAHLTLSETQDDWLESIKKMFEFFGGVTEIIICDCTRSLVKQACKVHPVVNRKAKEFASFYGTHFEPTWPYSPQQKGGVEQQVKTTENRLIAPLKDHTYFSFEEMKNDLQAELLKFNHVLMKRFKTSRKELFDFERKLLLPLPPSPFEIGNSYRLIKADASGCITIFHHRYSVPDAYRSKRVRVAITPDDKLILLDPDSYRTLGIHAYYGDQKTLLRTHTLAGHRKEPAVESKEAYDDALRVVSRIGKDALQVALALVERVGTSRYTPKVRILWGIVKLQTKYGTESLNAACRKVIDETEFTFSDLKSALSHREEPSLEKNEQSSTVQTAQAQLRSQQEAEQQIKKLRSQK